MEGSRAQSNIDKNLYTSSPADKNTVRLYANELKIGHGQMQNLEFKFVNS